MIVTSVAVVRIFFSTKLIQLHNQKKIISNKVNCYFEHPLRNYIFILSFSVHPCPHHVPTLSHKPVMRIEKVIT